MSEALAIPDDTALFNDAEYSRAIQERTRARAKAFFHGPGFERLLQIARGADDRQAMSAITTIGKLAGEFKAPRPVVLNFNELQAKAQDAPAGPLSDLTQIREAELIEGDEGVHDTDITD